MPQHSSEEKKQIKPKGLCGLLIRFIYPFIVAAALTSTGSLTLLIGMGTKTLVMTRGCDTCYIVNSNVTTTCRWTNFEYYGRGQEDDIHDYDTEDQRLIDRAFNAVLAAIIIGFAASGIAMITKNFCNVRLLIIINGLFAVNIIGLALPFAFLTEYYDNEDKYPVCSDNIESKPMMNWTYYSMVCFGLSMAVCIYINFKLFCSIDLFKYIFY